MREKRWALVTRWWGITDCNWHMLSQSSYHISQNAIRHFYVSGSSNLYVDEIWRIYEAGYNIHGRIYIALQTQN